jgi:hypothetical protein
MLNVVKLLKFTVAILGGIWSVGAGSICCLQHNTPPKALCWQSGQHHPFFFIKIVTIITSRNMDEQPTCGASDEVCVDK